MQERDAELAHEPAYVVAAEPDEQQEITRQRAPPMEVPDNYYYYPKFKAKVRRGGAAPITLCAYHA